MLYKESAIAVMVAVMLGAASLLGGLSTISAFAIHDPDAVQIASKTISQPSNATTTIDAIEFTAKKSTLRSSGTLTVAIVQDGEVLDTVQISTRALDTSNRDLEASLDDIELTDDFDVVFMYEGSGALIINGINVLGATGPAENTPEPQPEPEPTPSPTGTAQLTVKAIDQNGATVSPGLFVAVLQGMTLVDDGLNDMTFTLDAGETYVVEMGDYYDADNAINYEFEEWVGSGHTDKRISVLLDSSKEITARYTITTNSSPPTPPSRGEPPSSPPAGGGSGTITVFANRIPDPNWGPTFTGANVQMYFVLYNSTGWIVHSGFFDENGHTITGLNDGETYWISPTDCDECHGGPHDVVFHHWEDNSTERQRAVTTGQTASAYYAYDPDP